MIALTGSLSDTVGMKQSVTLEADTTYTFSAYIKTTAISPLNTSDGVYLAFADSTDSVLAKSERIYYQTANTIDNGWEKISVTWTPSSSGTYHVAMYIQNATGTACGDDFQLEVGDAATSTNLLQDGSFEDGDHWDVYFANVNPLRYRGYYYDTELGFYYLQSRYYDPSVGRFVNADAAEYSTMAAYDLDDTNLFAYCRNNPVSSADIDGEWVHLAVGAVVGGIIGGVTAAIGGGSTAEIVTGVLTGAASGALTASGAGLLGSIVGNAAISMAGNVANQVIENKGFSNFDVKSMAFDTALGAVSGAMGKTGASYGNARSAMSMGKQFVRRVSKTGEFKKALVYYGKSMKNGAGKSIFKEMKTSFALSNILPAASAVVKYIQRSCAK